MLMTATTTIGQYADVRDVGFAASLNTTVCTLLPMQADARHGQQRNRRTFRPTIVKGEERGGKLIEVLPGLARAANANVGQAQEYVVFSSAFSSGFANSPECEIDVTVLNSPKSVRHATIQIVGRSKGRPNPIL